MSDIPDGAVKRAARGIMQQAGICAECLVLRDKYPASECNAFCAPKVEIITAALITAERRGVEQGRQLEREDAARRGPNYE